MSELELELASPPPPPPIPYAMPDPGLRYAGFGLRLLGWFLDSLILNVLSAILFFACAMLFGALGLQEGAPSDLRDFAPLIVLGVIFIASWLYYAGWEASKAQATPGKMAAGIWVEDVEGGHATFVQTSVRFFVKLVSALLLMIGFLMMLFTKRQQALHDIGANTIVTVRPPRHLGM